MKSFCHALLMIILAGTGWFSCKPSGRFEKVQTNEIAPEPVPRKPPAEEHPMARERDIMLEVHLQGRDIQDPRVLAAMGKVPRHEFVPPVRRGEAYADRPLPIGSGQTISQPYIVAYMTQLLNPQAHETVLEIGTGSGYQAAVLAEVAGTVYSVEIHCHLLETANALLKRLKYTNIHTQCSDGYKGWPEKAPFDAIMVTAAPPEIPQALVDQLKPGGRLLAPVGVRQQVLVLLTKDEDGKITTRTTHPVRFVPMIPKED